MPGPGLQLWIVIQSRGCEQIEISITTMNYECGFGVGAKGQDGEVRVCHCSASGEALKDSDSSPVKAAQEGLEYKYDPQNLTDSQESESRLPSP